ncbi:MAG TPA: SCO family protein, partial [Planctomycetota bacterium]|nr:SCO family protein [Planctomycetota bacterium]
ELEGVGITEKLDAKIPLDLTFRDETGREAKLAEYFDGKPVLLTLNYSSCPMLCNLQLNGLVDALIGVPLSAGKDFRIVTVSLDPKETLEKSNKSKRKYLLQYGREGAEQGWHFLTGEEKNIRALADSVGFGYRWLEERQEYLHSAAFIFITPDGRVSRYLYGVKFDSGTVKLALLETGEGKVGSIMDQMILFCFKYDPQTGKYSLAAVRILQGGAALTVLALFCVLGVYWRREFKRGSVFNTTNGKTSADVTERGTSA